MKEIKRKCIACNEVKDINELIKITKNYISGEIEINYNNKIQGRSAYICKNETCTQMAIKKDKIIKSLKLKNNKETKEKIKTVLKR